MYDFAVSVARLMPSLVVIIALVLAVWCLVISIKTRSIVRKPTEQGQQDLNWLARLAHSFVKLDPSGRFLIGTIALAFIAGVIATTNAAFA